MHKFDYGVFIGRLNPVHNGHIKVIKRALESCDYLIIVLGSANVAENTRNPFTVSQRKMMIQAALPEDLRLRVLITSSDDYMYNDEKWLASVQGAVNKTIALHESTAIYTHNNFKDYNHSIALTGMHKDSSSYYLNLFPQWDNSIAVTPEEMAGEVLSATNVRKKIFRGELAYCTEIHPTTALLINTFMEQEPQKWTRLFNDFKYEDKYEMVYGKGPHVTVDSVVIQSGQILLVERGGEYGQGNLALPGGFLERNETILAGAIRELREETRLKLPEKVLKGSLEEVKVFDNPFRSNRSRIITHAHLFRLTNSKELPKVQGNDDAAKAHWYPLSLIQNMQSQFFEDHYEIIDSMISL